MNSSILRYRSCPFGSDQCTLEFFLSDLQWLYRTAMALSLTSETFVLDGTLRSKCWRQSNQNTDSREIKLVVLKQMTYKNAAV